MSCGAVRMMLAPVPRDIDATTHPYIVVPLDVVEEARQRGGARRTPGDAAMQADRQHLRALRAFGIQHVESVFQITEKLLATVETLRRDIAHVVGVERVRHDELRLASGQFPV